MSKVTERFEAITRVRSYFFATHLERVEAKEVFTKDVLRLLNEGDLDLSQIEAYQYDAKVTAVQLDKAEEKLKMSPAAKFWRNRKLGLAEMQFNVKPICGREFCLRSLAMASDMGANVMQIFSEPRIDAILMGLHCRLGEKSELQKLDPEMLDLIIKMALWR